MWKCLVPGLDQVGNILRVPDQKWSRARPSKDEAGLRCLVAMRPWMSLFTSLSLDFLSQKTGLKILVFTEGML